jgi:hypothetical protein
LVAVVMGILPGEYWRDGRVAGVDPEFDAGMGTTVRSAARWSEECSDGNLS